MSVHPYVRGMDSIRVFLKQLVSMDHMGGRIVLRDDHTLVLYDISIWDETLSNAVRLRHPECEITCLASTASLSGFIVIVKRHVPAVVSLWSSVFVSLIALVGYVGAWVGGMT